MEAEPKKSESTDISPDTEFMKTMRDRLDRSITNESEERELGAGDVRFINGEQWDDAVKAERDRLGRLTLTINKMPAALDQIDGDIRLNTPGLKVKAVDDDADVDTADVLEGLLRYIQRNSRSTKVHSYAGLHAAASGRGAWRIRTQFVSDVDFKQEIKIERIINSFAVYFDPGAQRDDKQDGMYFFIMTTMSTEEYKETYNQEPVDFAHESEEFDNWHDDGKVRVAEYFYKDKVGEKTIYQMDDGSILTDEKTPPKDYDRKRQVPIYKIKWCKVDGKKKLEEGTIPGQLFPVVLTWGKQLCVDGVLTTRGIARHAKDAAMSLNYFKSNDAESAALQNKQSWVIADTLMTDEHKKNWDTANDENHSALYYKPDPNNPGLKPYREAPAVHGSANVAQIQMFETDLRHSMGQSRAALGQQSNETSGVALKTRQRETDTGQFAYIDNLQDAEVTEGKIILGMIPEVYDFETQLRILGKDNKEKLIKVNEEGGINFQTGKYDVDIGTGGSYSTQREEFQDKILGLLPLLPPEQVALMTDILVEMQDFHRAEDIATRIKKTIPPEFLEDEDDLNEDENNNGIPDSEEQPPDPAQVAQEQAMMAEKQKYDLEIENQTLKNEEQTSKTAKAAIEVEQERTQLAGMKIENEQKQTVTPDQILAMVQELKDEGRL